MCVQMLQNNGIKVSFKGTNKFFGQIVRCCDSVVMSSDSEDPVSLSGSQFELDLDDIFGESDKEDGNFVGFVKNEIPPEIQCQWSRTADDNCQHFTEFNAVNTGPTRNNRGKNPGKSFGFLRHGPTGMLLRSEAKIQGNTELNGPPWKTQASFKHFFAY